MDDLSLSSICEDVREEKIPTKDTEYNQDDQKNYRKTKSHYGGQIDGGYGWVIVFGSFLSHVCLLGMVRSFGILYIEILRKFGQSATKSAMVSAIFNTLRMLLAPMVSVFCKRFSCRISMFVGSIGLCMGFVVSAFATNLWYLNMSYGVICGIMCGIIIALYGLQTSYYGFAICASVLGIIEGGYHAQRVTIISEIVEKSMLPETVGISIFFQGIGNIIGPLLGGYSKDTFGTYSMGYFVAGTFQAVICALFLLDYLFHNNCIKKCSK